jgi:hypothetical protein
MVPEVSRAGPAPAGEIARDGDLAANGGAQALINNRIASDQMAVAFALVVDRIPLQSMLESVMWALA